MRRSVIAGLLCLLAALPASTVSAQGGGPAQLQRAGWDCFQPPPDFNPYIHCAPPGQLEGIVSGEAATGMFIAFATTDLEATTAPLLGTERLIRADLFHGQPCPTDPPTFEWSSLFPRFGWDYYICHTFDSPW
jgi:hypothetical protein